jgi:hypothetical protein
MPTFFETLRGMRKLIITDGWIEEPINTPAAELKEQVEYKVPNFHWMIRAITSA